MAWVFPSRNDGASFLMERSSRQQKEEGLVFGAVCTYVDCLEVGKDDVENDTFVLKSRVLAFLYSWFEPSVIIFLNLRSLLKCIGA